MGTGTVKGFAQTLALGIVVSLFTALVVTKLILNAFYAMGIRNEKFYGRAKETKVIDFLGKKKIFFILSAVVIIAGFVTMGVHKGNGGDALNYSLEFKGGTSTSVEFNEDMSIEELDEKVVPIIEEISKDANVQTQKVQGSNQVIFKSATLDVSQREELNSRLEEEFGVDPEKITAETISSTISSEMRTGRSICGCGIYRVDASVCMVPLQGCQIRCQQRSSTGTRRTGCTCVLCGGKSFCRQYFHCMHADDCRLFDQCDHRYLRPYP